MGAAICFPFVKMLFLIHPIIQLNTNGNFARSHGTVHNAQCDVRPIFPGHRAAALLQIFLPLVCHPASGLCSSVHFQTMFSQISISDGHFPTLVLLLRQHPSVVKRFNKVESFYPAAMTMKVVLKGSVSIYFVC